MNNWLSVLLYRRKEKPKKKTEKSRDKSEEIKCILRGKHWVKEPRSHHKKILRKKIEGKIIVTHYSEKQSYGNNYSLEFIFPYKDINDHKYISSYMNEIFQPKFLYIKSKDNDKKKSKDIPLSERLLHIYGITTSISPGRFTVCSQMDINDVFKHLSPHIEIKHKG